MTGQKFFNVLILILLVVTQLQFWNSKRFVPTKIEYPFNEPKEWVIPDWDTTLNVVPKEWERTLTFDGEGNDASLMYCWAMDAYNNGVPYSLTYVYFPRINGRIEFDFDNLEIKLTNLTRKEATELFRKRVLQVKTYKYDKQ